MNAKTKQNAIPSIDGLKKGEALTILIQSGMDFVEAEKYWKENRPTGGTGWTAMFYGKLEEGKMTESELDELMKLGSENTRRHKSHFNAIRVMSK